MESDISVGLFNGELAGNAMSDRMTKTKRLANGLIIHSDRGSHNG